MEPTKLECQSIHFFFFQNVGIDVSGSWIFLLFKMLSILYKHFNYAQGTTGPRGAAGASGPKGPVGNNGPVGATGRRGNPVSDQLHFRSVLFNFQKAFCHNVSTLSYYQGY